MRSAKGMAWAIAGAGLLTLIFTASVLAKKGGLGRRGTSLNNSIVKGQAPFDSFRNYFSLIKDFQHKLDRELLLWYFNRSFNNSQTETWPFNIVN